MTLSGPLDISRRNPTGWCICQIGGKAAVGMLPAGIQDGAEVEAAGVWDDSPSWGKQFKFTAIKETLPRDLARAKAHLARVLPGIGPSTARAVVEHFGADIYAVLDDAPERLKEVPGIGEAKAQDITGAWKTLRVSREADQFFAEIGVTPAMQRRIFSAMVPRFDQYKDMSEVPADLRHAVVGSIRQNPYCLIELVDGIGFKRADAIANRVGIKEDSPHRVRAAIVHTLKEAAQRDGHCYLGYEELAEGATALLWGDV